MHGKVDVDAAARSLQSCPILCDPIDTSPPGSSVHGIFQAKVLDGVPLPSPKVDVTRTNFSAWFLFSLVLLLLSLHSCGIAIPFIIMIPNSPSKYTYLLFKENFKKFVQIIVQGDKDMAIIV